MKNKRMALYSLAFVGEIIVFTLLTIWLLSSVNAATNIANEAFTVEFFLNALLMRTVLYIVSAAFTILLLWNTKKLIDISKIAVILPIAIALFLVSLMFIIIAFEGKFLMYFYTYVLTSPIYLLSIVTVLCFAVAYFIYVSVKQRRLITEVEQIEQTSEVITRKDNNNNKGIMLLVYVLIFVIAMIALFLVMRHMYVVLNRASDILGSDFSYYKMMFLRFVTLNLISAVFILFIMWSVKKMVDISRLAGILPIVITLLIELSYVLFYVFNISGSVVGQLFVAMTWPTYFPSIAVIMCFAIGYTIYSCIILRKGRERVK